MPDWVAWSPSGQELVFLRDEALFTVAVNGKKLRKLHGGRVDAPDWSPSGTSIVFVHNPSPRDEVGLIQSIEIDDRKVRSIVRGRDPDVSPDGAKLAFAQRKGIYVMPLDGWSRARDRSTDFRDRPTLLELMSPRMNTAYNVARPPS